MPAAPGASRSPCAHACPSEGAEPFRAGAYHLRYEFDNLHPRAAA